MCFSHPGTEILRLVGLWAPAILAAVYHRKIRLACKNPSMLKAYWIGTLAMPVVFSALGAVWATPYLVSNIRSPDLLGLPIHILLGLVMSTVMIGISTLPSMAVGGGLGVLWWLFVQHNRRRFVRGCMEHRPDESSLSTHRPPPMTPSSDDILAVGCCSLLGWLILLAVCWPTLTNILYRN